MDPKATHVASLDPEALHLLGRSTPSFPHSLLSTQDSLPLKTPLTFCRRWPPLAGVSILDLARLKRGGRLVGRCSAVPRGD